MSSLLPGYVWSRMLPTTRIAFRVDLGEALHLGGVIPRILAAFRILIFVLF